MDTTTPTRRRWRPALIALATTSTLLVGAAAGVAATDRFSDVPASHTFVDDIQWLSQSGVTGGYPDGTYRPSQDVNRGQMAAFMHRLSGNDPRVAPTVNAATLDGLTAEQLIAQAATDTSGIEARLAALEDQLTDQADHIDLLESRLADQADHIDVLEGRLSDQDRLLAGVARNGNNLVLSGMNLHVVNGTNDTDTTNGTGNIIVGYNAGTSGGKTGSHNVVIGDNHWYRSHSSLAVGRFNQVDGPGTVAFGVANIASGDFATVTGGSDNGADGELSSISGGQLNTTSSNGVLSSVLGGARQQGNAARQCHPAC